MKLKEMICLAAFAATTVFVGALTETPLAHGGFLAERFGASQGHGSDAEQFFEETRETSADGGATFSELNLTAGNPNPTAEQLREGENELQLICIMVAELRHEFLCTQ